MLKLYRMHKAVRIVNQKTREIYNDPGLHGFHSESIMLPSVGECIAAYRPWLIRNERKRERVVRRAFISAKERGYLETSDINDFQDWVGVTPAKGEDFIEMWFWGLFREVLKSNNVPIAVIATMLSVGISALSLYFSLVARK